MDVTKIKSIMEKSRIGDTVIKLLFGTLLGLSASHIAVAGRVSALEVKIESIDKEMMEERKRNDDRIFHMVSQIEKIIDQNAELIRRIPKQ